MQQLTDTRKNKDNSHSSSNLEIPENMLDDDNFIYTNNQEDNGLTLDTLRGPYPNNTKTSPDEFITSTNLNEKLPDNMHNFLISLCKCLELTDDGCSACLIDNKIIVTFIGVSESSSATDTQMTSVLKFIELILNKNFKNDKDFEDLYDLVCSIRDHSISLEHACYENSKFLSHYTTLLKDFKWIKRNDPDPDIEDPRVKKALKKFAVAFNRVISSKYLKNLRNWTYKMEIAGVGQDRRHSEINLARHLMKRFDNDRSKIKGLFIASSKRPCFTCDKILHEYLVSEPFSLGFYSREPSKKKLQNYVEYWPKFLVDKKGNKISYQDCVQKYPEGEYKAGTKNTHIQFVFEEIDDPYKDDYLVITINPNKRINREIYK